MRAIEKPRRLIASAISRTRRARWHSIISAGPLPIVAVVISAAYLAATIAAVVSLPSLDFPDLGFDLPVGDPQVRASVLRVTGGGPAEQAGLRVGDVILAVDGEAFRTDEPPPWTSRHPGEVSLLQVRRATAEGETVIDVPVRARAYGPIFYGFLDLLPLIGVLYLAIAVVVSFARRSDPAGVPLLVCCASMAVLLGNLVWQMVWPTLTGFLPVPWITLTFVFSGLLHLSLAFPTPHPVLTRLREFGPGWLRRAGGATFLLYLVPPVAPPGFPLPLASVPLTTLALLALVRSYRRSPGAIERAQLRWITWSFLASLLAPFLVSAVWRFVPSGPVQDAGASICCPSAPSLFPLALFPIGVGFAIVRYRLVDVDRVLRATLLYPLMGLALVAALDALSGVASRATVSLLGINSSDSPLTYLILIGALAPTWRPVRQLLNRGIDGIFYADRVARQRYVLKMWAYVDEAPGVESVADALTRQAVEQLKLVDAWLLLADGAAFNGSGRAQTIKPGPMIGRVAELRQPVQVLSRAEAAIAETSVVSPEEPPFDLWYEAGAQLIVPLAHAATSRGERSAPPVGLWMLGRRTSGALFDRDDLVDLGRLARHTALVVENTLLRTNAGRAE